MNGPSRIRPDSRAKIVHDIIATNKNAQIEQLSSPPPLLKTAIKSFLKFFYSLNTNFHKGRIELVQNNNARAALINILYHALPKEAQPDYRALFLRDLEAILKPPTLEIMPLLQACQNEKNRNFLIYSYTSQSDTNLGIKSLALALQLMTEDPHLADKFQQIYAAYPQLQDPNALRKAFNLLLNERGNMEHIKEIMNRLYF